MVDKRFCFASALGHAKSVGEEFFDDEEMWCGCEGRVEGEYGSRSLEAVAWKVEFRHSVY